MTSRPHSSGDIIKDASQIKKILESLYDNGAEVFMEIDGMERYVIGLIEKLDFIQENILLNLAPPIPPQSHLKNINKLQLATYHRGIRTEFSAQLLTATPSHDNPYLSVKLPKRMLYFERRDAFRVTIPGHKNFMFNAKHAGQALSGRIKNISATGILIELPIATEKLLNIKDELENVLLTFEDKQIKADITIVRVANSDTSHIRFGCQLGKLKAGDEAIISRIIMEIQREQLYSY